jgi:hypothetical protein
VSPPATGGKRRRQLGDRRTAWQAQGSGASASRLPLDAQRLADEQQRDVGGGPTSASNAAGAGNRRGPLFLYSALDPPSMPAETSSWTIVRAARRSPPPPPAARRGPSLPPFGRARLGEQILRGPRLQRRRSREIDLVLDRVRGHLRIESSEADRRISRRYRPLRQLIMPSSVLNVAPSLFAFEVSFIWSMNGAARRRSPSL